LKNARQLEQFVTLKKMRDNCKIASPLEKCFTLKNGQKLENGPRLEKFGTLGKERHTWKKVPHVEKLGTLGKMRHPIKNAPQLEKCATLGECATLGKVGHT